MKALLWVLYVLSLLTLATSRDCGGPCKSGYECDTKQSRCVAVTCQAAGACEPGETCVSERNQCNSYGPCKQFRCDPPVALPTPDEPIVGCTKDALVCEDGTTRGRDGSRNCEFWPPCPCAGVHDLGCPNGYTCEDDTSDSCNPETGRNCRGLCQPERKVCTQDALICEDGSTRGRDGTRGCQFWPPCPCGGFAGWGCADGYTCVDDTSDDCDPKNGGADCSGLCQPGYDCTLIDCRDGFQCDPIRGCVEELACTDDALICEDGTSRGRDGTRNCQFWPPCPCAGFAGWGCPDGYTCADDTSDDCDPENGGADCSGLCQPGYDCTLIDCRPGFQCDPILGCVEVEPAPPSGGGRGRGNQRPNHPGRGRGNPHPGRGKKPHKSKAASVSQEKAEAMPQTYELNWVAGSGFPDMNGNVGDTWEFNWNGEQHSVMAFSTEEAYENCDFSDATELAAPENSGSYSFQPNVSGTYWLGCNVDDHCQQGQKVQIVVGTEDNMNVVDWRVGGNMSDIEGQLGQNWTFLWALQMTANNITGQNITTNETLSNGPHSIFELPDEEAWNNCDFNDSIAHANRSVNGSYVFVPNEARTYYFASDARNDCNQSLKIKFIILPEIDWRRGLNYSDFQGPLGSNWTFVWDNTTNHSVFELPNENAWNNCDFNGSTPLALANQSSNGSYVFSPTEAKTYYIASNVDDDCNEGMKVKIIVLSDNSTDNSTVCNRPCRMGFICRNGACVPTGRICPLDTLTCGDGSTRYRDLSRNCTFYPPCACGGDPEDLCPEGYECISASGQSCNPDNANCNGTCQESQPQCQNDTLTCGDGSTRNRDPNRNCTFFPLCACGGNPGVPCPQAYECINVEGESCDPRTAFCNGTCQESKRVCPLDTLTCGDNSTRNRDPNRNCTFFPACPCGGDRRVTCPQNYECLTDEGESCDPNTGDCDGTCQESKRVCPLDALICGDGSTRGRDPNRNCTFFPPCACGGDFRVPCAEAYECINDEGESCNPNTAGCNGTCQVGSGGYIPKCDNVRCRLGFVCNETTGLCEQDLCANIRCMEGYYCDPDCGECIEEDLCADVRCPEGWVCDPECGECTEDLCADVRCPEGWECDPECGECTPEDLCANVRCPEGWVCDPECGECTEEDNSTDSSSSPSGYPESSESSIITSPSASDSSDSSYPEVNPTSSEEGQFNGSDIIFPSSSSTTGSYQHMNDVNDGAANRMAKHPESDRRHDHREYNKYHGNGHKNNGGHGHQGRDDSHSRGESRHKRGESHRKRGERGGS